MAHWRPGDPFRGSRDCRELGVESTRSESLLCQNRSSVSPVALVESARDTESRDNSSRRPPDDPRVFERAGSEPQGRPLSFPISSPYKILSKRLDKVVSRWVCAGRRAHNVDLDQATMSQLWNNRDESDPFCVILSPQDDRLTDHAV